MSYYRTFMPTKEAMSEIEKRANGIRAYDMDDTTVELGVYCMLDHSGEEISAVISHIRYLLHRISYDAANLSYKYAMDRFNEDEDGEVWFCGWVYSHDEPDTDTTSAMNLAVDQLVSLACVVKTPDWFDESEKHWEKRRDIDEIIDGFKEQITLITDFEIIDKLKEFEVKDEDIESENDEETKQSNVQSDGVCSVSTSDYANGCTVTYDNGYTVTAAELNPEWVSETTNEE